MISTCRGCVEIWDQTVGCYECGEELWTYPGCEEAGLTVEQYTERFFERHPFMFEAAHDPGDEDRDAWDDEEPIGGYIASFNRLCYGNALERWTRN